MNKMSRATGKTLSFAQFSYTPEEVNELLIADAKKQSNCGSMPIEPNGLASVKLDNYRNFIVLLQRKEE
jgi:hypothetical protein